MTSDPSSALRAAREATLQTGDGRALVALVPYAAWLGVTLTVVPRSGGHEPLSSLPFRPDLTGNPVLPAIHGGVVAAFMENAALLHLLLLPTADTAPMRIPRSIDFSIDYLRSARTVTLEARCHVERIGRRVAQVQIRCTQSEDDGERCVAVARAHFQLAVME